jgi:hypothetical protein
MAQDIELKIKTAVESAEAAKSLGQLKRALIELNELQAQTGDSSGPAFNRLSTAASGAAKRLAETRDAIGDIQDKTKTLEGTPVERLTGSFGLLKESILNLDFDKAKIGVEGLTTAFSPLGPDGSPLKGLAAMKGTMANLGGTVKDLGGTFMSLGKALLTNPIFLIGAVIALVVVAIVKLMDSLGLLKPILDAIKKAIGFVVDMFEKLTDWLGLTTHAEEEYAKKATENAEKRRKAADEEAKSKQDLLKLTNNLTDEEIKLLEKKLGKKIDVSKSEYDIEQERLTKSQAANKMEIDALNKLVEAGGELTDEQKKQLEEREKDYKANAKAIESIEEQKQKAIIDANRKSTDILASWKLKNIQDENARAKEQLKITEQEELSKIDLQIREAKRLKQSTTDLDSARLEIVKYFDNEESKISKRATEQKAATAKENADKYKDGIGKQLKTLEDAEAAMVSKTEEGTQARVDAEIKSMNAIEAFQKKNAKALGLTQDQLTVIYQDNIDKRTKLQEDFNKVAQDKENKMVLAAADIAVLQASNDEERFNAQMAQSEANTKVLLQNTELTANERAKIELEGANAVKAIDKQLTQYKLDNINTVSQTELSTAQFNLDQSKAKGVERIALIDDVYVATLNAMDTNEQLELEQAGDNEAKKEEIREKYRQDRLKAEKANSDAILEVEANQRQAIIGGLNQMASAFQSVRGEGNALGVDLISNALTGIASFTELANEKFDSMTEKVNAYTQAIGGTLMGVINAMVANNKDKLNEKLTDIEASTNAEKESIGRQYTAGKISKEQYDKSIADLDKKAKAKELEEKKKAFESDKKMKIASATIAGFTGAVAAFTGAMTLGPIAGPIVGGLLAGAVGVMTAMNISKISGTKFDSGPSEPAGAPSIAGAGGDTGGGGDTRTTFQPAQFMGLGAETQPTGGGGAQAPIKVYVSETDITSTQNKVAVIEDRAKIE